MRIAWDMYVQWWVEKLLNGGKKLSFFKVIEEESMNFWVRYVDSPDTGSTYFSKRCIS